MTAQDCADCAQAAQRPHHGFRQGCLGCKARGVSRGPHFRRCRDAGKQDRLYRAELEQAGVSHQQVIEAAQADKLERGR